MSLQVAALGGSEIRKTLQPLVDNYEAKLDAWESIAQAVSLGNLEAEKAGYQRAVDAAADARRILVTLVERLSPAERERFSQAIASRMDANAKALAPAK